MYCTVLQELVLEDSLGGKATKTLLYKLSESTALAHFRRLVLASSPKDSYVPAYSARIQVRHCTVHTLLHIHYNIIHYAVFVFCAAILVMTLNYTYCCHIIFV